MKGKLVVIDGLDGTGKQTQVELLRQYLIKDRRAIEGKDFAVIDFPRYNESSSWMVKKYLSGEFSNDPRDINSYLASSFYSIDRAISYKNEEWGKVYDNGGLIIADRYTCSNIIYQGAKLLSKNDTEYSNKFNLVKFAKWLYEYEYTSLGIPVPNRIVYLKLSEEANNKMLEGRKETAVSGDIHEKNKNFLNECRFALDIYQKIIQDETLMKVSDLRSVLSSNGYTCRHSFINISDENGEVFSREKINNMIRHSIFSYNPWYHWPHPIPELETTKD